ncbi:MAG: hypothetical protein OEZ59_02670 [Deltaproteobacteria bacterium]|nr:hypothetical protein [Deltaproteobacteria bacterium]
MKKSFSAMALLGLALLAFTLTGCTASRVEFDKSGIEKIGKLAVILYTVPESINYRDNPQDPPKKGLLQMATEMATANNGPTAASVAQKSFIENLNSKGLSFKAISQDEMMGNKAYRELATKKVQKQEEEKAAAKKEQDSSSAGKALGMLSSLSSAMGNNPGNEGASPEGIPNWGLAPSWSGAPSAIQGGADEKKFIKEAIAALGVDGAMIINDPGMSFSCDACIGGTGSGSTGSAFLATIVDKEGNVALEMRQWFAVSSGNAAMVTYAVNPLQHENLFTGHGEKMARVFSEYYKEEGGK